MTNEDGHNVGAETVSVPDEIEVPQDDDFDPETTYDDVQEPQWADGVDDTEDEPQPVDQVSDVQDGGEG